MKHLKFIFGLAAALLVLPFAFAIEAEASEGVIVNAGAVNVRSGPRTPTEAEGDPIGTLAAGTSVTIHETSYRWHRVTGTNIHGNVLDGWVWHTFVHLMSEGAPPANFGLAAAPPPPAAAPAATAAVGTATVPAAGAGGYATVVNAGRVHVRSAPEMGDNIIGTVGAGEVVDILRVTAFTPPRRPWVYITSLSTGITGYVFVEFLAPHN